MCGICGVIALDGELRPDVRAALPEMARAIAHRGPDAQGVFSDSMAGLGHRRLAIIDLATGDQPMTNEDGSLHIVFNGEIYNHRTVRSGLVERGYRFRTNSDTESILHAYREFGPECLERLGGMFAFAIYEPRKRELFLARDRLGKKPLFYAVLGNALHFSSEIKSFYASPCWDGTVDLENLEGYLSLGYFVAPSSIYRHVNKLEPGHYLRVRDGRLEIRKYWDVQEFDTDRRPTEVVLSELEPLLASAVRDRLESEVPLGAFLSGGIDSGLVVSFMADCGHDVVTTSIGFEKDANNELAAAAMTARAFNTRHFPHNLEAKLEEVLDPIVAAFDEPFADASAIPTWYVSRAAREHVTVALSGDGGDETFSGYDFRYVPHALEGYARAVLRGDAGRRLARSIGGIWPRGPRVPRLLRAGTLLDNLSFDSADAYYSDLCCLKPSATRRLMAKDPNDDPRASPVYDAVTGPYRRCPSRSPVQREQYADLKVYMPNDPLVKVDRMAMQHALEVRCPLLDHRVVEFAFRLPISTKMPRLQGKALLRSLAASRLPAGLSKLPKLGFTAPVASWLRAAHGERFREEALGAGTPLKGVLDVRHLSKLFQEHRSGQADHWYALWAAWTLARWFVAQRSANA